MVTTVAAEIVAVNPLALATGDKSGSPAKPACR